MSDRILAQKVLSGHLSRCLVESPAPLSLVKELNSSLSGHGPDTELVPPIIIRHLAALEGAVSVGLVRGIPLPSEFQQLERMGQLFLDQLASHLTEKSRAELLRTARNYIEFVAYYGPSSDEHVALVAHGLRVFEACHRLKRYHEGASDPWPNPINTAVRHLLESGNAGASDLEASVLALKVAKSVLSAELPWSAMQCREVVEQVFKGTAAIISREQDVALQGNEIWNYEGSVGAECREPEYTYHDHTPWTQSEQDESAALPRRDLYCLLAQEVYASSLEVLLQQTQPKDVDFWQRFLSSTPVSSDKWIYGVQGLERADQRAYLDTLSRMLSRPLGDSFSPRNLLALAILSAEDLWIPNQNFFDSIAAAASLLSQQIKDNFVITLIGVVEHQGRFLCDQFDSLCDNPQTIARQARALTEILCGARYSKGV